MQHPLLETFPLSSPYRRRAEREFGLGPFKRIDYDPKGPLSKCYWTVERYARENGGAPVYGWQILQWPKLYIQALHHAVWLSPGGQLIDITEKYESDRRPFSVFCSEDEARAPFTNPPFIDNKYLVLSKQKEVLRLIEISESQLSHTRDAFKIFIANGASWHPDEGLAVPPDAIERLQPLFSMTQIYQDQMSEAFAACARISA